MSSQGLFLMFSGSDTIVRPDPETCVVFPIGDLPSRIFQGETFYALSRIIRNCIVCGPMESVPYTDATVKEGLKYIRECFLYDEFRHASHLGLASFLDSARSVVKEGLVSCFAKVSQLADSGNDLIIPVSRCETMRDFLSLCYDFYLEDLEDGHAAFMALAAVKAGKATEEEKKTYSDFLDMTMKLPPVELKFEYDEQTGLFVSTYRLTSFRSYMAMEYMRMHGQEVKYRQCLNPACGKYFIAKRSTAMYCDYPSPQDESRTCKELYPQIASRLKMNQDAMLKKIRGTQSRLYNVSRRHPERNIEVEALLVEIKENKAAMMQQVTEGTITMKAFSEWLDGLKINE